MSKLDLGLGLKEIDPPIQQVEVDASVYFSVSNTQLIPDFEAS